jgi:hypothetical protein
MQSLRLGHRNDPLGLARRAWENLRLIEKSYSSTKAGHVVTQLIQSLLALVVFPKEQGLLAVFKDWQLDDLEKRGWIRPRLYKNEKNDTHTLFDLLRHMRNAVCHGLVEVIGYGPDGSDSRNLDEISISFSDRQRDKPIYWIAVIDGRDLKNFCEHIHNVIHS